MGKIIEKMTHSYERIDQYENRILVEVYEDVNSGKIRKVEITTFLYDITPAKDVLRHVAVYQPKMKEFEGALEKEILYLEKFENCKKTLEMALSHLKVLPEKETLKKELEQAIKELEKYEKVIELFNKELNDFLTEQNR